MITLSNDGSGFIDQLIEELFKSKQVPDNSPDLLRAYGDHLTEAIAEGYGGQLNDFEWNSPDYETVWQLQNNVWQFAAAKQHVQLRDMAKMLVDSKGHIRSFEEFRVAAEGVVGTQLRWLQAEYNTILAGAQMAAFWNKIQAEKHIFPLLEFDATIDDRSSTICPPLNKIILPVDHPFWKIYFPPNHFNCRSRVRQLREGTITPDDQLPYPDITPVFKGNAGIDGGIISKEHPYFEDTPAHVTGNATLYMEPEDQYITTYEAEDGTQVNANRKTLLEAGEDLENLQKVAETLADEGKAVDILPAIHASETELRNELLPGVTEGKNPDLMVHTGKQSEYTEVKAPESPVTFKKLQKNIAKAAKQADRVIVLLEDDYDTTALKAAAIDRFRAISDLQEIGFVTKDGEYIEFFRKVLNERGQQK